MSWGSTAVGDEGAVGVGDAIAEGVKLFTQVGYSRYPRKCHADGTVSKGTSPDSPLVPPPYIPTIHILAYRGATSHSATKEQHRSGALVTRSVVSMSIPGQFRK